MSGHGTALLVPRLAWAWLDNGAHFDLVLLPILVVAFAIYLWALSRR